jgi:GntR family transcriptional regulator
LVNAGGEVSLVEDELTDSLSASRSTVRAVLQQLARDGLVTREPKNGTRSTGAVLLPINELKTAAQFASEPSIRMETRTLECRPLGRPPMVSERLRLPAGWTVLMTENLRLQNGVPIGLAVEYIAVPEDRSSTIEANGQGVVAVLERQLGVRIGTCRTTIGALAADEQTAQLLDVEVGAPLMWLEDVIEDEYGRPRALSQLRLRGDRVALQGIARR